MRIFSHVHYFCMSTTNMLVWGTKFYAVLKHKYVTFDICFKNKSKLIINSHHGNRFRPYYVGLGTTVRVQHAYEYLIVLWDHIGKSKILNIDLTLPKYFFGGYMTGSKSILPHSSHKLHYCLLNIGSFYWKWSKMSKHKIHDFSPNISNYFENLVVNSYWNYYLKAKKIPQT